MKPVLKQVLLFSFFILLIAGSNSSFTSLLNYIHKAHGEEHMWHAQAFFVINSISCILFNILIPNLKITNIRKISFAIPIAFLMSYMLTYLGFRTSNIAGSWIFTALAAIFSGIGSSTIWIVSGKYIHLACQINDSKQEQGRLYGIFGGIMACNFFVGAILSASSLEILTIRHNIYLILSVLAVIGIFYCKFLIVDLQKPRKLLNQSTTSKNNNQEEFNSSSLSSNQKEKWISIDFKCDKACLFKNISVYKRMSSLIPFQFLNGLTVGYIFHCAEDLVFAPSQETKSTFLTITLMFIGFGSAVGAYTAGYLCDKLSSKKVFSIGVISCLISFVMGMMSLAIKNEPFSLATSFASGFGMMYTNNMLIVMCSRYYEGSMMVFATNRQVINFSFMLFNIGINVISPQNMHSQMYYELGLFIVIGFVALYMVRYIRVNKYGEEGKGEDSKLNHLQQRIDIEMKIDASARQENNNI